MEHHHSTNEHKISNSFIIGIVINMAFIVMESFYGIRSNSVALLADAGHNFSDVITLVFVWFSMLLARMKPNFRFTYGLRRTTILSALVNTLLLISAVFFIISAAVSKFREHTPVHSSTIIIIALIGIVINAITAWLFVKEKDSDLNIKSAFIHFMADTYVSLGVVVGGVLISLTGLQWIDPLISLLVAAFILYNTYDLLIDTVNLVLDAVPRSIDLTEIQNYLLSHKEVESFHDLHVWALSTSETALTVHLVTKEIPDKNFVHILSNYLERTFKIGHCTIQIEHQEAENCENPCN
jgi:cobalt-zinc-cadmium efflux system protein